MEIKDISGKPMRAVDVYSISINFMKNTLLEELNKNCASEVYDQDIDFVLSVPSIWGDAGKLLIQEAAVQVRFKLAQTILT